MTEEEYKLLVERVRRGHKVQDEPEVEPLPGPKVKHGDPEHKLQCACVQWFRLQYPDVMMNLFAVPNGGRRDRVTGGKLKAEGVLAGVADLILLMPCGGYHALLIEMKTSMGRQSEAQKMWQRHIERFGYKYVVCRGVAEFVKEVNGYFKLDTK